MLNENPPIEITVPPRYGQVLLKDDVRITDFPPDEQFDSDENMSASSSQAVHVFTIPDDVGNVVVKILRDPFSQGDTLACNRLLNLTSRRIAVTTADRPLPGEALAVANLEGAGRYPVKIYVGNTGQIGPIHLGGRSLPDRVTVIIGSRVSE